MEVLAVLDHILPVHNGGDGGGVGGGPADPLLLQGPDEGGLGVPGGGLGELLLGLGGRLGQGLPLLEVGQAGLELSPSSSRPSSYTARKPGNFTSDRLALNT